MNYLEVKKIRKDLGLTQEELANELGVNIRTIQKWEGNETKIRKTSEFMLTELHRRKMEKEEDNVIVPKNKIKHIELPNGQYLMHVPMIPLEAHARYISDFQDADFFTDFEEVSFIVEQVGKGNYKAFKVKGDSMNGGSINDTEDGAVVLGRELQKHHWQDGFRESKYGWILITHHNILFKDIIDSDLENNTITCHSRNPSPEYADFTLNFDEIHQLFRILKRTF